ncbi:ATP-binding protein [Actinosynnema pretiosum]|uniref:ATP-binding protein n=1 Tax=Actinosynnema pretiosum TaxID=42197 RepID=A0A290Z9F3_9PSEU|nr:ATP-binding protein [Actinosynnema pretiosum]ATE55616.1 ATP-binding protein [Actinosynnema pretiosum]
MNDTRIRPRERDAIIQSLRAGVVPRSGQQHVQVGRMREVDSLLHDLDSVADGGSTARFVIGEYGSGKTFFLNLIRSAALKKRLVTVHADLAPDRRLHATGGQARSLYTELARNTSTAAKPDGGALAGIVERFVSQALATAREQGASPEDVIRRRMAELSELVGGYDFAAVVEAYWRGHDTDNEQLKIDAVRWLRGEFATKTEARAALGVRTIVDDANFYDQLKLLSRFVRMAGYSGLLVCLDEMVNLYKLTSAQARSANYEQILRIVNDSLQGISGHIGFLFGGTPEFLMDTRRGLYSYEALQSRLVENTFATGGLVDHSGPVLRLTSLTQEDFYVLLTKLRHVHAAGDPEKHLVPDEALHAFMDHCAQRVGDAYFRTPRTTIREFLNLLSVLEHNQGQRWEELVGGVRLEAESNPDLAPVGEEAPDTSPATVPDRVPTRAGKAGADDELATFRL